MDTMDTSGGFATFINPRLNSFCGVIIGFVLDGMDERLL